MKTNDENISLGFNSLKEIDMRKRMILKDIRSESKQLSKLWDGLFHKKSSIRRSTTGGKINSIVTSSAGLIDGMILGWKLYRKFKRR